jgi:hypothetical protein
MAPKQLARRRFFLIAWAGRGQTEVRSTHGTGYVRAYRSDADTPGSLWLPGVKLPAGIAAIPDPTQEVRDAFSDQRYVVRTYLVPLAAIESAIVAVRGRPAPAPGITPRIDAPARIAPSK